MFKNYIKIALRTIFKHKLFSFINVFGLALSLSFCLLVIVIINDQTSFDKFHPRENDVYRVITDAHRKNGGVERYASTPQPLGTVFQNDSPAVETLVCLTFGLTGDATVGGKTIPIQGFFADPEFFDLFGFQLAVGDPATALKSPNAIVLTSETAAKYFGDEDPLGKTISIRDLQDFVVTGVMAPAPGKTHLEFEALGSSAALPALDQNQNFSVLNNWNNYYASYNYFRAVPGHNITEIQSILDAIPEKYYGGLDLESRDAGYSFHLQKLTEITPGPVMSNNLGSAMPSTMIYFLGGLAVLGLLAAVFNYTNLTLARSFTRAKEVGVRKVSGAARRQLLTQFLIESTLVVAISLAGAIVLLNLVLIRGFESLQIAGGLNLDFIVDAKTYLYFAGFTLLIGVVAGFLPAIVVSRFRPIQVLKDVSKLKVFSKVSLRKALIVFQFALSLLLIILVTIVYQQVNFALRMDYGFAWQDTMSVRLQGVDPQIAGQELGKHAEVINQTMMSHNMGTWEDSSLDVRVSREEEPVGVRDYSVDANFVNFFELAFIAGENYTAGEDARNASFVLVNEQFLEKFKVGTPHEAVGKALWIGDSTEVRIAGVLKDFLYKPLVYDLEPVLFHYDPVRWNRLFVKVHRANAELLVAKMESSWKTLTTIYPLNYTFYDDILRDVYSTLSDMTRVVGFLALLASVISLLGLLGIAAFNAESRVKEIGVRKVLGANVRNLLFVLSKNDMLLIAIAAIIAVPASLWLGGMLLQTFAYRISLGPGVVAPGVASIIVLGGIIVGWQAARAAFANPVTSLRSE